MSIAKILRQYENKNKGERGWSNMVIKSYEPLKNIIPSLITVIAGVTTYYYRVE